MSLFLYSYLTKMTNAQIINSEFTMMTSADFQLKVLVICFQNAHSQQLSASRYSKDGINYSLAEINASNEDA